MCGIAGILSLNNQAVHPEHVRRMGACIRHRGPDEEGEHIEAQAGLMIERLKVIDLVTGSQPIYNENKDAVVVFNGEIYNYKDLRLRLEKKGHQFSTNSDTETVIHSYEENPDGFLNDFNGMFGLAVWDLKRKRLTLARDRAGIKPVFYAEWNGLLLFASEMKAILSYPGFPREMDREAFHDYLSFYYVSAPRTIYRRIRRLPPGFKLTAEAGSVRLEPYWDLRFSPQENSWESYEEEFRSVLDRSVQRHLQSDVPVGVFLSGGLDSSSLVESASRFMGGKVKTYSIGYSESSFSELEEARLTAGLFKTDHHEIRLAASELQSLLPKVVAQHDEPHGDWSHVAQYVLSREAKKDVTVVLAGMGGDELFGGYPTYFAARMALWYRALPGWFKRGLAEPASRLLPVSFERMPLHFLARSFFQGADYPSEEAHRRFKEIFTEQGRNAILREPARSWADALSPAKVFSQYRRGYEGMDLTDRLMYLDFKVFLPYCALYITDIATSAHALECRVPFLDLEMLDLAARVPWNMKVRGPQTKVLMRRALKSRLPAGIINLKKKGFLIPGAPWIKGELKPFVLETVSEAEGGLKEIFQFTEIRRILNEHFEQKQDHTRRIACLVSFFLWHRQFKPELPG